MEEIDIEETEIRSEAVRDFLETIPNWLIRWGILSVSIVLLVVFSAGWWIHYPTIVVADFTLSSTNLPKPVIAKVDGRLEKIFVKENQKVKTGEMLGYLESTASHNEVLRLESELKNFDDNLLKENIEGVHTVNLNKYYHLGEIQNQYQDFQQNYVQMSSLFKDKYFQKRKDFIENDINETLTINEHLQDQLKLYDRDVELSDKEYKINEKLLKEKVIAKLDLYREESKLLAKKIPIKNIQNTILNNRALVNSKQREILELESATLLQKESFKQSLNVLKSNIEQWKSRYVLLSPIDGRVNLAGSLQEKQYLKSGSEILFISTQNKTYLGEIRIPQANFGKVKKGQKVLIKLQGYPFEEFGSVHGRIVIIAELSSQDNQSFWATVSLPNGLLTDANKKVEYKTGMKASAEIVTEDMKLIERLLFAFKRSLQTR
jgi:multidrug resistance efflux pump